MADAMASETDDELNPWTTHQYPREGRFAGFDRLVNFTDAVYAIALTLAALEIGLPEIDGDQNNPAALWEAIAEKGPKLAAFAVAFVWVAIYWRANHRFTATLRSVSNRFVGVTLVYLAFVAILPWPAEMLGEYWGNPVAVATFALFVACVSALEVVMWQVAYSDKLFLLAPSDRYVKQQMIGASSPVVIFLVSIPLAFVAPWLAVAFWVVASVVVGMVLSRVLTARPSEYAT
jgi:uncharacterized membrane protein